MLFLEVFGELIKPVSLSLRLFGNIFGEHTAAGIFFWLFPLILTWPMMGPWSRVPGAFGAPGVGVVKNRGVDVMTVVVIASSSGTSR